VLTQPWTAVSAQQSELGCERKAISIVNRRVKTTRFIMLIPTDRLPLWNRAPSESKATARRDRRAVFFLFLSDEEIRTDKPKERSTVPSKTERVEDEGWRVRRTALDFGRCVITSLWDKTGHLRALQNSSRRHERGQAKRIARSIGRLIACADEKDDGLHVSCTIARAACRSLAMNMEPLEREANK